MSKQYDKVYLDGKQVTRRQRAAVFAWQDAIDKAGLKVKLFAYQGSWRPVTPYSGTTHTKAGVVDLGFFGMGDNELTRKVLRLGREVGCQAAFLRGPMPQYGDFDDWHFHCCDLDTWGMDSNAAWQVSQYKQGFNGLNSGVPDPNPYRPEPLHQFNWERYLKQLTLRQKVNNFSRQIKQLIKRRSDAKKRLASLERH